MSHLPRRCRKYLADKGYQFFEHAANGSVGVIVEPWKLPEGKYDHEEVALLLLLPNGYPDSAPDMFYLDPWIKVKGSTAWPKAAEVAVPFHGRQWQRWSRHWSDWRPGIDAMPQWLIRVRHALEVAR